MEILRKNQKELLEMENSAFSGFICILDTAKERISEFDNVSIETYLIEMQRGKRIKKIEQNIQEPWNSFKQ